MLEGLEEQIQDLHLASSQQKFQIVALESENALLKETNVKQEEQLTERKSEIQKLMDEFKKETILSLEQQKQQEIEETLSFPSYLEQYLAQH